MALTPVPGCCSQLPWQRLWRSGCSLQALIQASREPCPRTWVAHAKLTLHNGWAPQRLGCPQLCRGSITYAMQLNTSTFQSPASADPT